MTIKNNLLCVLALSAISSTAAAQTQNSDVQKWAQQAAIDVMTVNFVDIDQKKQDNKILFTDTGYKNFYIALDRANIPQSIKDHKLMVQTEVLCLPEIIKSPTDTNAFYELQFPYKTSWVKDTSVRDDYTRVTLKVAALEAQQNKYAIEQWIARPIDESQSKECSANNFKRAQIGTLKQEIKKLEERIHALEKEITP